MKKVDKYSSPSEWPWYLKLFIGLVLLGMVNAVYLFNVAERRCIAGAEKAGYVSEEFKQWCKDTF